MTLAPISFSIGNPCKRQRVDVPMWVQRRVEIRRKFKKPSHVLKLSPDLQKLVFSFLDFRDHCNLSTADASWHRIGYDKESFPPHAENFFTNNSWHRQLSTRTTSFACRFSHLLFTRLRQNYEKLLPELAPNIKCLQFMVGDKDKVKDKVWAVPLGLAKVEHYSFLKYGLQTGPRLPLNYNGLTLEFDYFAPGMLTSFLKHATNELKFKNVQRLYVHTSFLGSSRTMLSDYRTLSDWIRNRLHLEQVHLEDLTGGSLITTFCKVKTVYARMNLVNFMMSAVKWTPDMVQTIDDFVMKLPRRCSVVFNGKSWSDARLCLNHIGFSLKVGMIGTTKPLDMDKIFVNVQNEIATARQTTPIKQKQAKQIIDVKELDHKYNFPMVSLGAYF